MPLALYSDANSWLDGTKIRFENEDDAEPERSEAETITKGALVDLYEDHINLWTTTLPIPNPDGLETVPDLVRTIVSLLMAAYRYQRRYSEETMSPSTFAQGLETRAMDLIRALRTNNASLTDPDTGEDIVSGIAIDSGNFWPNDSTVVETGSLLVGVEEGDPLRFFNMDEVF
jgi:hypothetical protein